MCKMDFIDWLLDLEEYFNFWMICDEEKVRLASSKLDNEAKEWWEDIQIDRKQRGKQPIRSWQRMKRVLIDLWFPNDYYDILDYTSVDYKSVYSYEKQYIQNQNYDSQVHVSSKGKGLRVKEKQLISKENFEVFKKDQDLLQVIELKIENTTCQKFEEEVKETKVELIVNNDKNEEMLIIENIVEDSIKVKYEDESTTHNPQVSVDLLKMATPYVDFLGVENFNFTINPLLIDVANKLKIDEKKFYATLYDRYKFQNRIKLLKHSRYLFTCSGRFQISKMNSRTSLF